eukprot:31635_1
MATKNPDTAEPVTPTTKRARRSNSTYFIFYFFLWMFIGSLWILPPLLFNKILIQCDLSLVSCAVLFCIYYVLNGLSSLLSRFMMNNDGSGCTCIGSHLLSAVLIILCIASFELMRLTNEYMHQLLIWSVISIVDGYLNNAAPVYLYRIYHIEASIMLTLCTIIAHFTSMIIAMTCIKSGSSYRGTLNFVSFFGVVCCLGLIGLKSPTQKELIEAIKQRRNQIIEKKLERIDHRKEATHEEEEEDPKWHSMRKESKSMNGYRTSMSGTLSTYFHEHAPEMSFNPSVIQTINTANRDSHIQYPINAKLHCIQINDKMTTPTQTKTSFKSRVSELQLQSSPIMEEEEPTETSNKELKEEETSFNTFASSNVRKIIAYSTNPPILAHSVNDSTFHALELIWKEIDDTKDAQDGHITPEQLSKLKTVSTAPSARSYRKVLFSEANEEMENRFTFHSMNSLGTGYKTPDNPYWFDIEKRFESVSIVSKRADTALASYIMNDDIVATPPAVSDRNSLSQRQSTMKPIEEEENPIIASYLRRSKQILFVLIVWITMICSAQRLCYVTFITQYVVVFVGAKELIAICLICVYLFGDFVSRCAIIFLLKRYSAQTLLLMSQFLQFVNCVALLVVDWSHVGTPSDNKESRRSTKIMLFLIMFIAGATSSPINVICFSFLNAIQKVTNFLSTIIHFTADLCNAISIITMAFILTSGGIQTFPYYIILILFCAIIIAIAINIKYMIFRQRLFAL